MEFFIVDVTEMTRSVIFPDQDRPRLHVKTHAAEMTLRVRDQNLLKKYFRYVIIREYILQLPLVRKHENIIVHTKFSVSQSLITNIRQRSG